MAPAALPLSVLPPAPDLFLIVLSGVVVFGIPLAVGLVFMRGVDEERTLPDESVHDLEQQIDHLEYGRNP
ncbi:hypothetical protein [Haladaptatus sp. CMSO5]|uniref:hypothetical protein n=1 Tax=Haladaptatus sp. CMSO5 TaxID=3120514 RepID=UPI002FCE3EFB